MGSVTALGRSAPEGPTTTSDRNGGFSERPAGYRRKWTRRARAPSPDAGVGLRDDMTGGDPKMAMRQEYDNRTVGHGHREATPVDEPARAAGDPTLVALDELSATLDDLSRDQRDLAQRIDALRQARQSGASWQEILSKEEPPGSMQVVSQMLARLSKASGTVRKELVDVLRSEGASIPSIARLFGVTHQRVSNLLRRSPD